MPAFVVLASWSLEVVPKRTGLHDRQMVLVVRLNGLDSSYNLIVHDA